MNARSYNTVVTRDFAEMGSDRLCQAMRRIFMRSALRHGITVRDATLLLMNGVEI